MKKQLTKKQGIEKLKKLNIKTTNDLDNWRNKNGRYYDNRMKSYCIISRYEALVNLVGDNAAMWIMNDLAINQCSLSKNAI